ncbi:MAG TPA: enolase C-terminal domain-like protein, partial [Myxococcales bacterium]|nr:enolase C-terminal domain-like protein [Myxococcales bacterium]
ALDVFFRRLKREKRPFDLVAKGCGYSVAHLRNKRERIEWSAFLIVMQNVQELWTKEEQEELGAEWFRSPYMAPFTAVARLVFSALDFYRWMFTKETGVGDQSFACIDNHYEELGPTRLRLELQLRPGYQPCPEFFLVSKGTFSGMPEVLGLPRSKVEMEMLGNGTGARYLVELPPGGGVFRKARQAVARLFAWRQAARELKDANEALLRRYGELEVAKAELGRNAEQLHAINEAGKELSQHTELTALGDAVSQMLYSRFGCSGLRLWLARNPGDPLVIVRESGEREGPQRTWQLSSGGEVVGRIDAWRFSDNASGLFDGLVPWIAIALNNARSFAMVKRAQSELEQRVQERTRELSATTAKLSQSVRQLTEMDEQKTQFFANASHELRTPLTLMLLPVESMLTSTGLSAETREKLDGVLRGGYRLLKLINDLLDLSKIEAGKMHLRMGTVDLVKLLEEVVRPWRAMLSRRGVTMLLQLPAQLPLVADGERLEQVAMNLVSNAVKHVPDGGKLVIGASGGGAVHFWVENSGEGIDPSEVDQIFERFGQSSKAKGRRFGTTGLGLPLVKDLVELHSGTIGVLNEPGRKVRFEVRLPMRLTAGTEPETTPRPSRTELRQYEVDAEESPRLGRVPALAPAAEPEGPDRPVLLLVEDNDDLRSFLAGTLGADYQVLQASDGAAGLKLARERHPDIVLSVDANAAYTPADAALLRELDAYGLLMIEQPLAHDDLVDHARLQRTLATAICLDESITSHDRARQALETGASRIVNLKIGRVGGYSEALRIHDLCVERGVPLWCGGMLESGIGRAHNVALASLAGFTLPGDISGSRRYFERDVIVPPVEVAEDGTVAVPTSPGLGFEVDVAFLESRTESVERLRPS